MGACAGLVTVVVTLVGMHVVSTPVSRANFALQSGTASGGMTNEDVIKMAKAGLAEDVIITSIRQAPRRNFDITPNGLIELKLAKVPDAIVRAMQALEDTRTPETTPAPAVAPAPAPPTAAPVRPSMPAPAPPPPPMPAPAAAAPAALPTTAQEPSAPGDLYFVSSNGSLVPLERVRMKEAKLGKEIQFYYDGSSSPVVLKAGEPQSFAIRMLGGGSRFSRQPSAEEAQRHFLLTKLQSAEGRRYITKVDVQFDVRPYGRATPGLDPRHFERLASSFQLIPRTVLAPGEYVVRMAGTKNFEFVTNYNEGDDRWAFAVVER